MAKTRIKQPAIEAAQDKAEVTTFIRKIGDLQREVKRLETEAGDKKAVIEEEYAAKAAPMCAEIMSLTERVAAYCEAHKDELRPLQNSPKSPKFPQRHLGDFP